MVKLKLSRTGKKHQPTFRIVAVEAKSKRDGEYIEMIGHYSPLTKDLVIDKTKYDTWITKGAQPTETVASLYTRFSKSA